jgi:hypothetical protein
MPVMRFKSRLTQREAGAAVIRESIAKAMPHIALAHSAATLCDEMTASELVEVAAKLDAILCRIKALQGERALPNASCGDIGA